MTDYVVALRRNQTGPDPDDLARQLSAVSGVSNVKPGPFGRLVISATPDAVAAVREQLGASCVIEPVILHDLSKKPQDIK